MCSCLSTKARKLKEEREDEGSQRAQQQHLLLLSANKTLNSPASTT
jgi:hypothetical protein